MHKKSTRLAGWSLPAVLLAVLLSVLSRPSFAVTHIDFSQIADMARMSELAYHSEQEIRRSPLLDGYQLFDYHNITDSGLAYFVVANSQSRTQVIVLRGTANAENAMLDISAAMVKDPTSGLMLHEGFAFATQQIFRHLRDKLDRQATIITTGHSLGGALALVLAKYLQDDDFRIKQVLTFGQPRVTNRAGATELGKMNILRVVTPLDMVPLTPPFDPMQIMNGNLDVYWHAGTELLLLEGNRYSILQGIDSMLRATRFSLQNLPEQALGHHAMTTYLQLLADKGADAREVPFEPDLDLFGWFGR